MFNQRLTGENFEDTLAVARDYCSRNHVLFNTQEKKFLIYKKGIWVPISEEKVCLDIIQTVHGASRFSVSRTNNVIKNIQRLMCCESPEFNKDGLINFKNGTFDVKKLEIKPHNPEDMLTMCIPYDYKEDSKCELWLKTLDEIFEGNKDYIRTVQEFFGYCLTKNTKHEKILVFMGRGANGKSVILHVLSNMMGEENCSALSLNQLAEPMMLSGIVNKLVNISTEISRTSKEFEDVLKAISSGEEIMVNPKYVQSYKIKPYCKLIFSCNTFPRVEDKTDAFYRRLLLIEFKRSFSEQQQNKNLKHELLSELPGIFNWAVQGLKNLNARGYFEINQYMKNSIENLSHENNQLKVFCMDEVDIRDGSFVLKGELYDRYKIWATKNGHRPMSSITFGKEFFNLFCGVTKKDGRGAAPRRDHIWPNICWKEEGDQVEWRE